MLAVVLLVVMVIGAWKRRPSSRPVARVDATYETSIQPELDKELDENPERGMPFGFPPLSTAESDTIATWLRRGAGGPPSVSDDANVRKEIAKWEDFLDGHDSTSDSRPPLVAAYLFENIFYAHIEEQLLIFFLAPDSDPD